MWQQNCEKAHWGERSKVAPRCLKTSRERTGDVTSHRFCPPKFAFPFRLSSFCGTKKRWAIVGEAFASRSSFFTSHSITRCIVAEIVIEFWNISMGERYIPKDMVLLCVRNVGTYLYCAGQALVRSLYLYYVCREILNLKNLVISVTHLGEFKY